MTTTTNPVPSRVSNGRLIEQMLLWGWTIDKRHGDMVLMKHPIMRRKIDVRAATYHKGNTTQTIRDVYDLTTDNDAARFWARTEPLGAEAEATLVAPRPIGPERPEPEPDEPAIAPEDRFAAVARSSDDELTDRLVASASYTPPAEPDKDPPRVIRNRGLTNKVFESLLRDQRPTSSRQLAVRMGHDVNAVSSALSYLYSRELLERVKTGFYQLPPDLRTEDVRVIHRIVNQLNEGLPLEYLRTTLAHDSASTPPLETQPLAVQDVVAALTPTEPDPDPRDRDAAPMDPADVDDLIDTVLDMMFPDGFKARHRRTVDAWAEATRKLIVEVGT